MHNLNNKHAIELKHISPYGDGLKNIHVNNKEFSNYSEFNELYKSTRKKSQTLNETQAIPDTPTYGSCTPSSPGIRQPAPTPVTKNKQRKHQQR